jgi:hypothetical protein
VCWHGPVDRCDACLRRNPLDAAPPIPFEDPARGFIGGLLGTLFGAFAPVRTAPAFAGDGVRRAVVFAVLVTVPLALVRGVIPYTRTLRFGPTLSVEVLGGANSTQIALDLAAAAGISLLVTGVCLLALTVPFVSLARAYGSRKTGGAPLRLMLYRGWLLTVSAQGALFWFLSWCLPAAPDEGLLLAIHLIDLIPLLLLLNAMRATSRLAQGVGPIASFVTVIVPLTLMILVQPLLMHALAPWLPEGVTRPQTVETEPQ